MKRFQGGLVLKVHRLLYHSTLGLRVIKKKKRVGGTVPSGFSAFDMSARVHPGDNPGAN